MTTPLAAACPNCLVTMKPDSDPPLSHKKISCDLLKTNKPPLDFEIPSITDFIAVGLTKMTRLEARIALLTSALEELVLERDDLKEQIRNHESVLSPLRRMPIELLSLIFSFTLASHERYNRETAPWNLGQVSSYWREIVLSQPTFWVSCILNLTPHSKWSKLRLETQLQRSGNLPIDVIFSCYDDEYSTEYESGLLCILARHCARWRTILLEGPYELFAGMTCIQGHLPQLRELRIDTVYSRDLEEIPSLDVFQAAPNLRQVFINMGYWSFPVATMLPFSQLSRYGGSNSWEGHLATLRSASNLVECALEIRTISTPSGKIISLPQLLRLSLSNSTFLDCIETPALQELYCHDAAHLFHFFQRPSQVQKLAIGGITSAADIAHIIPAVPTITHISVTIAPNDVDDIFSLLTMRNGIRGTAPALEAMAIWLSTDGPDPYINTGSFPDMLESRINGTLRFAEIVYAKFSDDIYQRLQQLRVRGLKIALQHTTNFQVVSPELCLESDLDFP